MGINKMLERAHIAGNYNGSTTLLEDESNRLHEILERIEENGPDDVTREQLEKAREHAITIMRELAPELLKD